MAECPIFRCDWQIVKKLLCKCIVLDKILYFKIKKKTKSRNCIFWMKVKTKFPKADRQFGKNRLGPEHESL